MSLSIVLAVNSRSRSVGEGRQRRDRVDRDRGDNRGYRLRPDGEEVVECSPETLEKLGQSSEAVCGHRVSKSCQLTSEENVAKAKGMCEQ